VAGECEPYRQYFARHFGQELCDDHSAAAFDRLIKEFNYGRPGRNGKPSLLVVSRQPGGYLLHDGVHRAAILKHRNVSRVKVLELLTEDEKPEMPSPERTAPVAAGAPPPVHSLEVRVIAGAQKDRWQHHITDEVAYWDGYIKTRGRPKYAEEFATRLQPDTPLQETITKTVTAAPGALVRILDVGAGPLTWLGKRWEGRTVELVPVDPLANHYHDILQRHGVQPPVATRCADAEALTNHFPLNHFEVVHARNSIDHSYDAPYAIEQMLAVTKPGGWVILGHGIRESTAQQGQGLHQWDFFSADGDFVIESRQHLSVNLTHRFAGVATVQCEVNREKQWLRVCMQKLVPTVLQPVPMTAPAGPAGDGPAFQLALREGEQLLRQGRLREARTRLEQAVKLAPTAGCAARAEEILTLLPGHASPAKADAPVVVKLMGGLGNQLFQYAAGLALARKNQVPLKLDLTFLQDRTSRPHLTPRDYALAGFPLHDGCELIREAGAIPAGLKRVAEKHFHYDPAFADLPAGVLLEGYWQSPRYFEPIAAELRRNLAFAPQLGAAATALAAQIGGTEAVCLHVRRGDMVHDARTASVHGSCAVEYYRMACDVIAREFPAAHFFIFSDDPHWCGAQDLTRGRPHTVVSQDGAAGDPLVDLDLMRRCRHFITANSTFSWWAAFLGGAAGKRVIVPDPWFTDPSMDISDLFPQDWIHLSRSPGPVLPDLTPAPAVSVIVPCYKQAHYLPEAVASVVGQTFADWELIVVNDGSPDETSRVARDLIARHPGRRIRLLEKPNGGLADARNAGIREARGRLILPLDADDKLHPQMLQKTVALLKARPRVAIVYTDLARFGSVTDVVALPEYDFKKLVHQNQLNCCSLFRREAWAAVGGYNPNMKLGYEDWDFWIGCGEKGFFGQHLPEPLFFYRVKNSSMFTKALEHHHALHAQIIANHPRLYDEPTRLRATGILAQPATAGQPAPPASAPADALKGRRILVYTDDPGQGGAAHYNHALLLALVEAGAQVACAQPRGEGPLVQAQAQGGIQHCWTAYNPVVDFGRSFVDEDDARRILEQARPELVFFSDCCAFSHLAAKQAVLARDIPFVVICHSEATYLAERFARYLPTVQVQLERARAVIGVSQSSLGVMRRHFGLAADKGQVIYNGCAENYFAPADPAGRSRLRADLALPADAVLCFTAARLDAGKCHQLQLEAIRRLRDSGRLGALHFAWAGDGDLRPQLEQQVKALKLEDRVHLLGYRWDVRDLMGAADIFVLTTLYEAMPLCILEAMARGLPVLASAVGGIPEELGETGILLPDPNLDPQKTISTLANALVGLAADAPRRQAMSAAGKARAQQLFSARRMLESTLAVMGQALAEQSAAADEFFGADEVRAVEQLCTAYAGNPADAAVSGQLQSLQQGLMNFLVTAPTGQLEAHFKGSLGQVFRALCKSGLPSEPPTDEARAQLAVLDEVLTGPPDPLKGLDYRPLLARMLRAPAHRGATTVDPDLIPAWLLEDYLGYVLTAPPVFVSPGEAEEYHAHVLSWARTIQRRTRQAPAAAATIRLATAFANRANCIPLYSSRENLREIAQLRAAILEFVLTRNGAAIDAKLPRRPKHRQRIKVGFLSAHFGAQTETHVTLPALQLDREKFEVCLFPVAANPGPVETYCRSFADSFTPLPANLHQQVKVIRAAALDVLIIGTNITAVTNQVALIALHRLAPVQLATYCSPSSTGMRHIDGYLTGTHLDIPGLQEHFSEKLRFCEGPPGCLDYTVERPASAVPLTRAGLGLAADEVVFINAAACFKILPELQETWAKILRAVPNSRLLLLPFNPNWANEFPVKQFERTLAAACARHGVARDRFILASSLPSRADVKALERLADVYLDTFPFSGSISVIDPLELGLPTVVGTGPTARSRAAAALLQELGLPELITADEAGYVALAVKLGTDPAYRRQLHDRILAAMAQPPRFINPPAYAQELGELLASLVAGKKRPVETLALA
jgi:predicted O-linked N-acetylglucosamine transferase (SPINDLY family)/glycosyltransferase involved in cell wall biosynthesis/GT2 family glycosyltransferase/SAM-dependent methyltransferase